MGKKVFIAFFGDVHLAFIFGLVIAGQKINLLIESLGKQLEIVFFQSNILSSCYFILTLFLGLFVSHINQ